MKIMMVFGILATALVIDARAGNADAAPWCAWYDALASDCAYFSQRACLDTVRGTGGWCTINVYEFWAPNEPPLRRPKHARRWSS